jgi:hypothetical protein
MEHGEQRQREGIERDIAGLQREQERIALMNMSRQNESLERNLERMAEQSALLRAPKSQEIQHREPMIVQEMHVRFEDSGAPQMAEQNPRGLHNAQRRAGGG